MITDFAGFIAISALVIIAPGPDTAVVTRNALRDGTRGALATSLGVVAGLAVWTVTASVGLAALLRASEPAFVTLKLAGAIYLAYLGVRSLWDAVRRSPARASSEERAPRARQRPLVSLRQGLVSDLGNPKIAVFFTTFLPQFVGDHHASFLPLLTLGLIFCALTLAWLVGYSALVARVGDLLRRGRLRRALDGVTGIVLIGLGARLALERRT
ncbi:MAG: LysE family translocator [Solirubrobacteraceae bacterium]|jgi:threonine/homoserine/homoserine lactone efflux protein